ncbi:MAG: leucine-rich repeat domain-containing protein [Clostridia bacterium]|nr:leucine-rich repeat domain-containing protein [Clostridia bacterium]
MKNGFKKNVFLCITLVAILLIPIFTCAFSEEAVLEYSYGNDAFNKHMLDLQNTTVYNGAKWAFEHRAFSFESDFMMYGGNTRAVFEFEVPENVWESAVKSGEELYLGRAEITPAQKMDLYVFSGDRTTGRYVLTESWKNIGGYTIDVFSTYDESGTLRLIDKVFLYTCQENGAKKNYAASLYVCFENYEAAPADTSSQASEIGDSSAGENAANEGRLQAYAEAIRTLEEENSRLKEQIEGLNAQVSECDELRDQIDGLYEEIEGVYAELALSDDENSQLKAQIAALEAEVEKAEGMQETIDSLNSIIDDQNGTIEGCFEMLNRLNSELAALKAEAEKGARLLTDSEMEVSALGKAETAQSVKEEATKGAYANNVQNPQDNAKDAIISGRNDEKSEADEKIDYSVLSTEELNALRAENAEMLVAINNVLGNRAKENALINPDDKVGRIKDLFPDEIVACYIRDQLGKFSIDQYVTQAELDTITSFRIFSSYGTPGDLTGIGYLRNLEEILIDHNNSSGFTGTAFPEDFYTLKKLKKLYAWECADWRKNNINYISPEIGNMTSLENISLGYAQITHLPDEICNLTNLETLWLENTLLTEIPENIGNLTKLKSLNISNTQITALPESIWALELESINMSGTNIR